MNEQRKKFESWYAPLYGSVSLLGDSDQYASGYAQGKWQAWQAAIAAQEPKQAMTDAEIEALMLAAFPRTKCSQAYIAFAKAIERASSPNKELVVALQQVEQALIKLEHAVGGGDGEIYVEAAILTCQAALRAAGVEAA